MSKLLLIRHGQASFAEQDYDKLSIKGTQQAEILGEHWQALASHKSSLANRIQYYSGSLLRHEQTAEHFLNGLCKQKLKGNSNANQSHHSIITHAGFNELDHVDVLSCYNKNWQNFQAMCASVKQTHSQNSASKSVDKNEEMRVFQQEFIAALKRWVESDFDDEYQESWSQFKQRCITSLQDIIVQIEANQSTDDNTDRKDLVIFTSGGVIGVIVGHILQLSDQQSLQISQQLVNSSVTKIVSTKDGFKLNYLNNYSHLELAGQEWLSYF